MNKKTTKSCRHLAYDQRLTLSDGEHRRCAHCGRWYGPVEEVK